MNRIDAFKMHVFAKASGFDKNFSDDPNRIQDLLDQHDLVFAVWDAPEQPEGKDLLIIKGKVNFIFGHFDTSGNWTAFPCASANQAEAIQMCVQSGVRMGGDPLPR